MSNKLRPILFSTEMVQAILDGRKTQTRLVVKPKHEPTPHPFGVGEYFKHIDLCPYGQPGDILWVRETFKKLQTLNETLFLYKASPIINSNVNWQPSIHMPFAAARIFLRVKTVRVERLQEISEDDAIAEGCCYGKGDGTVDPAVGNKHFPTLWQAINGPESWDANPWVWVVEFERISREEALNVK